MVELTCPRPTPRGIWHSLGVEPRSRNSHPTSYIMYHYTTDPQQTITHRIKLLLISFFLTKKGKMNLRLIMYYDYEFLSLKCFFLWMNPIEILSFETTNQLRYHSSPKNLAQSLLLQFFPSPSLHLIPCLWMNVCVFFVCLFCFF